MRILVGISGSIGVLGIHAYLAHLKSEPEVEEIRIAMTPTATRFVSSQALEALLRQRIYVDPWSEPGPMYSPPELLKDINLYLIAPASATTLSRCASGSAETLLSHCYLSYTGPVAFAPAMSEEMWGHHAVRRNMSRLQEDGATILPPGVGFSAAAGKLQKGSLCPYPTMWPILKSLAAGARPDTPPAAH